MKKRTQMNNNGFSLVELIVCLAISTFVILAAYSLVLVGTRSYDNNNKNTKVQKEVSFTTNLLADYIRNADVNSTFIEYKTGDDVELHTGSNVICYDKSENALLIYEEVSGADYWPATYSNENLISKYVKSFNAEFISPEKDKSITVGSDGIIRGYEAIVDTAGNKAASNVIKFTMEFDVNGKIDTTQVMYQIRN